jgi:hypothetical protein
MRLSAMYLRKIVRYRPSVGYFLLLRAKGRFMAQELTCFGLKSVNRLLKSNFHETAYSLLSLAHWHAHDFPY